MFFPFPKWKRKGLTLEMIRENREAAMRWISAGNRPHTDLNMQKVENDYKLRVCSEVSVDR